MTISIRRIRPEDAQLLKRVRLAALLDEPSAFGFAYAAESEAPDEKWSDLAQERAAWSDHSTFFALDGDRVVGIVGGHRLGSATVELVSMWTDPDARGMGVGAALVGAVVEWASGSGVELWVTRGNDAARRLYERCGFEATGDFQALPSDPCKDEVRMRRPA